MSQVQDLTVEAYGLSIDEDHELEELEAKLMRKHAIVTNGHQTWSRVCKHMNSLFKQLPHEHHNLYRIWLLTKPKRGGETELYVEDIPKSLCNSHAPLKEGISLPYPSGPHWQRLVHNHEYKTTSIDKNRK